MSTLIHQRVAEAQRGENPKVICKMPSGWAVISDKQILPGYILLLSDPVVPSLNEMDRDAQAQFLLDMAILGDALLEVTGAARINYEILGNSEKALHAHIIPRYHTEPDDLRRGPVWFYDMAASPDFDPSRDQPLMNKIAAAVARIQR